MVFGVFNISYIYLLFEGEMLIMCVDKRNFMKKKIEICDYVMYSIDFLII